jgi:hypothetical protein
MFREMSALIIDGVEHLSRSAAKILSYNINMARGIADTRAMFGQVPVLMLSGLQRRLPLYEQFIACPDFQHAATTDFTTFPETPIRYAPHATRGQSPSPNRDTQRNAPPVRGKGPSMRARPRGGRLSRPDTPPRVNTPSPTRRGATTRALSRSRRAKRQKTDMTAILLDELGPDSSSEETDDDDMDFIPTPTRSRTNTPRSRRHQVPRQGNLPQTVIVSNDDEEEEEDRDDRAIDPTYRPSRPQSARRQYPYYVKDSWTKRKYRTAVASGTFKSASGQLDSQNVAYKHFGLLGGETCGSCNAVFFTGEGIRNNSDKNDTSFLQCCQHGKVEVPHIPIPEKMVKLLDKTKAERKDFLKNIRHYNNYFALASFQAKFAKLQNNFPYVVKLHGQITVLLHQAEPNNYVPKSDQVQRIMQGQFFFVDPEDARRNRENYEPNKLLKADIVLMLDSLLQELNVLYRVINYL